MGFRSKRGSEDVEMILNTLIKVIIPFMFVLVPVSVFIYNFSTSNYFEKNYLATDVALLTDTIIASPNDLIYNYPRDTQKLRFKLMENTIIVYKGRFEEIQGSIVQNYYIEDSKTAMYYKEIKPSYSVIDQYDRLVPIKLSVVRNQGQVRLYNANEDIKD